MIPERDWLAEGAPCFERAGGETELTTIARLTAQWIVLGNGSKYSRSDMVKVGERGRTWVGGRHASEIVRFADHVRDLRRRAVAEVIHVAANLRDQLRNCDPLVLLADVESEVAKARRALSDIDCMCASLNHPEVDAARVAEGGA